MNKLLLGVLAAFALVAATPVLACEDCKNCQHHKKETAQAEKATTVADAEKKDEKPGCKCHDQKDCKCGEKCGCSACKMKAEKKDEPKKS